MVPERSGVDPSGESPLARNVHSLSVPVVFVELKFGAESGQNQRERQRAWAEAAGAGRTYILLGTSYFEVPREGGVDYIGVPELREAIAGVTATRDVDELARAYLERLGADARAWSGEHDPVAANSVAILRLYQEIADAWPVDVHPWRATNPSGPDWILNGDAWRTIEVPGWEPAQFYWEVAGGHLRFKIEWNGDDSGRMPARMAYEAALLAAARELEVNVERTRRRTGRSMSAAQFPGNVREHVLVDGRVSPERSRQLYEDATVVYRAALGRLTTLDRS